MGIAEIRGEKIGRGLPGRVSDHLGQTNYAEIRMLVTKYISKLNKTQKNKLHAVYLLTYLKYPQTLCAPPPNLGYAAAHHFVYCLAHIC